MAYDLIKEKDVENIVKFTIYPSEEGIEMMGTSI